ncbi:hypothetical protein GDO78_020114 [Eleutherodactylus coqui]|uniref:Uncharacterized protein n=1 Tax=Eleutherodactylus coqui TaxID=57060 RepID=A0A8J6EIC2_ELECQ|nr:hypothetical protein GDO78_020114 [Eleutherodactylus coqui]
MGKTPQAFFKCTKNLGGYQTPMRHPCDQKKICLASPGLCSIGQYGHFNLQKRKTVEKHHDSCGHLGCGVGTDVLTALITLLNPI